MHTRVQFFWRKRIYQAAQFALLTMGTGCYRSRLEMVGLSLENLKNQRRRGVPEAGYLLGARGSEIGSFAARKEGNTNYPSKEPAQSGV